MALLDRRVVLAGSSNPCGRDPPRRRRPDRLRPTERVAHDRADSRLSGPRPRRARRHVHRARAEGWRRRGRASMPAGQPESTDENGRIDPAARVGRRGEAARTAGRPPPRRPPRAHARRGMHRPRYRRTCGSALAFHDLAGRPGKQHRGDVGPRVVAAERIGVAPGEDRPGTLGERPRQTGEPLRPLGCQTADGVQHALDVVGGFAGLKDGDGDVHERLDRRRSARSHARGRSGTRAARRGGCDVLDQRSSRNRDGTASAQPIQQGRRTRSLRCRHLRQPLGDRPCDRVVRRPHQPADDARSPLAGRRARRCASAFGRDDRGPLRQVRIRGARPADEPEAGLRRARPARPSGPARSGRAGPQTTTARHARSW